jgi:hypothetical protein
MYGDTVVPIRPRAASSQALSACTAGSSVALATASQSGRASSAAAA